MANFLLWADLQPEGLEALDFEPDEASCMKLLAQLLQMGEVSGLRQQVLLELYMNTLRFARAHSFSAEKTSTFFSIVKRNHEEMAEAFLSPERSWEYLKSLLLAHSVQRPPHSVGIFSLAEVQQITEFALTYYYAHFKLFRYAFTLRHVKEVNVRTSLAELPPESFPSLADGMPVERSAAPAVEAPAATPVAPIEVPPIQLDADVPDAVKAAVEAQIAQQVQAMRAQLDAQFSERALAHESQIKTLEAAVAAK